MKTSVIIPTYNHIEDLRALLDSIAATRLKDYEVLVVDDGSTDGTVKMCRERGDVRLISLEANSGPSRARNIGAARARGELLIFADSDVVLPRDPDLLREMVAVLERTPDIDCVLSISDIAPRTPSAVAYNYSVYHAYYMNALLGGKATACGSLMFFTTRLGAIRRSRFRASGGFYESLRSVMNEDGEFGARCYHLGYTTYCSARFVHAHRFPTGFPHFMKNYFRTALVQSLIDRKMDTSPDPSIGAAEKLRRLFALSLLASPLLLLRLPFPAYLPLLLLAAGAFIASFGAMNRLIWKNVPRGLWLPWYVVYAAVTPSILLGYLYGILLHLTGTSLLRGEPSNLDFFHESEKVA